MAQVKPVPEGYPRVIPYLSVHDANAAIEFYRRVFGATERMRMPTPDGKIGHAELEFGDSLIMLADVFPDMGGQTPKSIGGNTRHRHDVRRGRGRGVRAGDRRWRNRRAPGRGPVLW